MQTVTKLNLALAAGLVLGAVNVHADSTLAKLQESERYQILVRQHAALGERVWAHNSGDSQTDDVAFFNALYAKAFGSDRDAVAFCAKNSIGRSLRMEMVDSALNESGYKINGNPYSEVPWIVVQANRPGRAIRILRFFTWRNPGGIPTPPEKTGYAIYIGKLEQAFDFCNILAAHEPGLKLTALSYDEEFAFAKDWNRPANVLSSWTRPANCLLAVFGAVDSLGQIVENLARNSDDPALNTVAAVAGGIRSILVSEVDENGNLVSRNPIDDSAFHQYVVGLVLQGFKPSDPNATPEQVQAERLKLLKELTDILKGYDSRSGVSPEFKRTLSLFLQKVLKVDAKSAQSVVDAIKQENVNSITQNFRSCVGF